MATTFAVYCDTDKSLNFYKRDNIPEIGSEFDGKIVTNIFTGVETLKAVQQYTVPWYAYNSSITTINFVDVIQPVSTAYWFYWSPALTSVNNLFNLDTSNVTNMKNMFYYCTTLTSLDVSWGKQTQVWFGNNSFQANQSFVLFVFY